MPALIAILLVTNIRPLFEFEFSFLFRSAIDSTPTFFFFLLLLEIIFAQYLMCTTRMANVFWTFQCRILDFFLFLLSQTLKKKSQKNWLLRGTCFVQVFFFREGGRVASYIRFYMNFGVSGHREPYVLTLRQNVVQLRISHRHLSFFSFSFHFAFPFSSNTTV